MIQDIMNDLPKGFNYTPKGQHAEHFIQTENSDECIGNGQIADERIKAGDFVVELDEISMKDLKKMRKLIPRNAYISIKNRKSARLIRTKKKQ